MEKLVLEELPTLAENLGYNGKLMIKKKYRGKWEIVKLSTVEKVTSWLRFYLSSFK